MLDWIKSVALMWMMSRKMTSRPAGKHACTSYHKKNFDHITGTEKEWRSWSGTQSQKTKRLLGDWKIARRLGRKDTKIIPSQAASFGNTNFSTDATVRDGRAGIGKACTNSLGSSPQLDPMILLPQTRREGDWKESSNCSGKSAR